MYEVELKVPADHEAVRERLRGTDATFLGAVEQTDTYYDAPHRDFAETDEALRLRIEREREPVGDAAARVADSTVDEDSDKDSDGDEDAADATSEPTTGVLTYKGPLVDDESKTRREIESTIRDSGAIDDVVQAVGFADAATVEKRRERYRLGDVVVTLDEVADLGQFVEVETEVPTAASGEADDVSIAEAREELESVLRELGLDPADGIRTSYLGLLLADDV